MPIYSNLLDIVTQEQKIRESQVVNNLRTAEIDQIHRANQAADLTRQTNQALQLAQDQRDAANTPTTPQTADDGTPVANLDPVKQQVQQAQKDYDTYSELARGQRRAGVDAKDAEVRAQAAEQALFHSTHLMFEQQKEKAKNIASMAGAVAPDGSNVGNVVAQIDRLVPRWSKTADLDRDLMGNVVWGKHTQTALAQTQQAGETANQQVIAQQKALELKQQQARLEFDKTEAIRKETESKRTDERAREGIKVRERAETRLEGAANVAKFKEPSATEVKDTAEMLKASNEGLSATDAKIAARDMLNKTNDLLRLNSAKVEAGEYSREDAVAEAQQWVGAKIKTLEPGKPMVPHFFSANEPAVPAKTKYDRTANAALEAAGVPELGVKLGKAGVSFSITPDKGLILSDPATANAGIALLPVGTKFVGPDGKSYTKK